MRQFVTGQITNDELEERIYNGVTGIIPEQYYKSVNTADDAILPIVEYSWCLYDDTRNHYFESVADWEYIKREMSRIVLFLKSDEEYTWDYVDLTNPMLRFSLKEILKSITSLGVYYRGVKLKREEQFEQMKVSGNFEYWPFKTKESYKLALKNPPFMKGQN